MGGPEFKACLYQVLAEQPVEGGKFGYSLGALVCSVGLEISFLISYEDHRIHKVTH